MRYTSPARARGLQRFLLLVALLAATRLWAMPDSFSITVTNPNTHAQAILNLERYNLRGTNFTVRVYTDATTWTALNPLPEVPTYRGRVQGEPWAFVSAVVKPNGQLYAKVVYGNWYGSDPGLGLSHWSVDNVPTGFYPSNTYAYAWTANMPASAASGSYPAFTNGFGGPRYLNSMQKFTARRCNIAIEILNDFYINNCGSSVYTALAKAEGQMNDADFVTARDLKIAYQVTCVSIRAATQDPYSGLTSGGGLLAKMSSTWSAERTTLPFDKVHCFTSNGYGAGGMAYAPGDYSYTMDSGYYGGVICHEVGHNWWALDYEAPLNYTASNSYWHAMDGSGLCYCPETVNRAQENVRGKSIEWIKYNYPLPPYATPDYASTPKNQPVAINALLNDYSVNSNALTITWFNTNTLRGGSLSLSNGSFRYVPPADFVGYDSFLYRVGTSNGFESASQGLVFVTDTNNALIGQWQLEETNGSVVFDTTTGRGVAGLVKGSVLLGRDTAPGILGNGLHFSGGGRVDLGNSYDPLDASWGISFWFKPDSVSGTQYLLCQGLPRQQLGWRAHLLHSRRSHPRRRYLRQPSLDSVRHEALHHRGARHLVSRRCRFGSLG